MRVADLGGFEVEDYGSVVEVQSEHLTDQVTDILGQSLTVWITLCLDASAYRYHPLWLKDIRTHNGAYSDHPEGAKETPRKQPRGPSQ